MQTRQILFVLLASFLPFLAQADWTKIPSSDFALSPPPAPGSEEYVRDFVILHEYEKSRSQADCGLARYQEHPNFSVLFGNRESPLSQEEKNRTAKFVGRVMRLAERISAFHKEKFQRPRPFQVDSTLEPCAKKPSGSKSYPSSHATASTTGACVLANIFTEKSNEILDYGSYISELRVISGVHHPSDVRAGKALGEEICERLFQDNEFRTLVNEAKNGATIP